MKNDEMVTDANMLVTQNTITQDQIEEVNVYLEYEEGSRLLTNLGIFVLLQSHAAKYASGRCGPLCQSQHYFRI